MSFKKASKSQKKLVCSIQGASGSGKTFSALNIAKYLCPPDKKIAFIDTERSAELYANKFEFDVDDDFGTFGKLNYHPEVWLKKLTAAAQSGEYGVVIMDSLTHLWKGDNGFLAIVDNIAKTAKAKTGKYDSHAAWKDADPIYQKFMNSLRHLPFHVIFCVRAKQAYERTEGQNGKGSLKKVGLEPEFRDGFDYDVDAQFVIDEDHLLVARKHRLEEYLDGKVFPKPGRDLAEQLLAWCNDGKERPAPELSGQEARSIVATAMADVAMSALNDTVPDTTKMPPSVVTPESTEALLQSILGAMAAAATPGELTTESARAKEAHKQGLLSDEDLKVVKVTFSARAKEITAANKEVAA